MNVGSTETGPVRTGLPAVEAVSGWRRGRSTVRVVKPRTRLKDHREGPQLMVEAGQGWNVLETYTLIKKNDYAFKPIGTRHGQEILNVNVTSRDTTTILIKYPKAEHSIIGEIKVQELTEKEFLQLF